MDEYSGQVHFEGTKLIYNLDALLRMLPDGSLPRNTVAAVKTKMHRYGSYDSKLSRTNHNKLASIARGELKRLKVTLLTGLTFDISPETKDAVKPEDTPEAKLLLEADPDYLTLLEMTEEAASLESLASYKIETWKKGQSDSNIEFVATF